VRVDRRTGTGCAGDRVCAVNPDAIDTTRPVEHKPGIRYVCAVQRKPYTPPGERKERPSTVPTNADLPWKLQPFEVRRNAALQAEFPPVDPFDVGKSARRAEQRTARKAANRRKARRGWR
jgi:hypothetical protein